MRALRARRNPVAKLLQSEYTCWNFNVMRRDSLSAHQPI